MKKATLMKKQDSTASQHMQQLMNNPNTVKSSQDLNIQALKGMIMRTS